MEAFVFYAIIFSQLSIKLEGLFMSNLIFDETSRREFMKRVALTGAAAYMGFDCNKATAALPPPETTKIRIRQWRPACWAPIHVAEPLLRAEGFTDLEYVDAPGTEYPKMLKDDTIDLSPDFAAMTLYQIEKHKPPIKFLAGLHVGCYALVSSKRIKSIRDLKGKTVWAGDEENNGPHIFFSIMVAYVGLDPYTDINYAWVKKDEAMELFNKGKIDAFISFPPGPQELIAKKIGQILVDTNVDKPWSQYFCCTITGRSKFVKENPIATKRALRAILLANDIVAKDPEFALQVLLRKKIWKKSETQHILQAIKEIPYGRWREYSPEETIRFCALRLNDVGMVKTTPKEFIERYTDFSHLRSMKDELGLMW